MYGKGNTGPAREVWHRGDRVCWYNDRQCKGWVGQAKRDPDAFEVGRVWVEWDDGRQTFCDPNLLDVG